MNRTMLHRGPDDEGYLLRNGSVGLASRRLKIIDLSDSARMPMTNENGTIHVVQNGEIYNFRDLRRMLQAKGHQFVSNSDTEVIVHGYEEWGVKCFEKFNGMFAIAIWDETKQQLLVARDRLGVKPLYYYYEGKHFCFASELKPIMSFPFFNRQLDENAVYTFFSLHHVPWPLSILKNVRKLPPATYLTLSDGAMQIRSYWDLKDSLPQGGQPRIRQSDALAQLEELLLDSIDLRLISDVPLGAFLSGGVDSSLIVALMKVRGGDVRTFTIGFEEGKYNEAQWAKRVAQHVGTEHHELYLSPNDMLSLIPNVATYFDEPFGDPSLLPTLCLAQFARTHVTVALSGDGGDELFLGYPELNRLAALHRVPFVMACGQILSGVGLKLFEGRIKKVAELFSERGLAEQLTYLLSHVSKSGSDMLSMSRFHEYGNIARNHIQEAGVDDPLTSLYYALCRGYLPDTVLTKTDRAGMAHSLEAREPLLDYRIVEFATRLPLSIKARMRTSKHILKQILYRYVPRELVDRPKSGFAVPLEHWFRGPLKQLLQTQLDKDKIRSEGILNPEEVARLVREHMSGRHNHSFRLWTILNFELWLQQYFN